MSPIKSKKQVFLSFSSKEILEAKRVCALLEKNRFDCFIANRDLVPGKEYAEQLIDNMDKSGVVVLLLSRESASSPHVLREIEYAVSHKIPIIVYKLEEVIITKSLEYFLMTHQWISEGENRDEKLIEGVRRLLSEKPAKEPEDSGDARLTSPKEDKPKRSKLVPILLVILGVLLVVVTLETICIVTGGYCVGSSQEDAAAYSLQSQREEITYSVGDTITFGRYYGAPIEWRVLKIHDDGTMTLLSKNILTKKSFDAPEGGVYNEYDGVDYWSHENYNVTDDALVIKIRGNNDWSISNIRCWLNSDEEVVNYPDQAPTFKAVGENYYNSEPGFLYEFSEKEKAALVEVSNRTIANPYSEDVSEGYVTSKEAVYLLSSEELGWIKEAGMSIYASPTAECEEHDAYKASYDSFVESYHTQNYYWWLRDNPNGEINKVYVVTTEYEGDTEYAPVNCGASDYGVRPALTVNIEKLASCEEKQ